MTADGAAAARVERIRALVQDRLHPERLEIRDDSAAHAGHAGAGSKGHFSLYIVARCFQGLAPIEQHRLVHAALEPLFAADIHALTLRTSASD